MAKFRVQSPDGQTWEVEAPDGTPENEVLAYAQSQFGKPQAKPQQVDPTGSFGENAAAGLGKAVVDTGRGLRQLGSYIPGLNKLDAFDPEKVQAEIDEAKALDAPLMKTGGGMVGNIGGQIAATLLPAGIAAKASKLPMLARMGQAVLNPGTVGRAAAVGAGIGGIQPVATGESRSFNILMGAGGGAVGQKAGDKIGQVLKSRSDRAAAAAIKNAGRDEVARVAREMGMVIPPTQTNPTLLNRTLEGLAGKLTTGQAASIKNQPIINNAARAELGIADDVALSPQVLETVRREAVERGYNPVKAAGRVATDDAYTQALDDIVRDYRGIAADFPGAVDDSVTRFVDGSGQAATRRAWVDNTGQELIDFRPPPMPKLRSLVSELKQAGGVSVGEVGEIGENAVNKNLPGLLNKKTGLDADGLLEWAQQNGWLSAREIAEAEDVPGGATELAKELVRKAVRREQVIHPAQADELAAYVAEMGDLDKFGIRQANLPGSESSGLRVGSFDAANGMKLVQKLRDEANAAFAARNADLGRAKKAAAKALEDQLERGIASQGAGAEASEALDAFRQARTQIAKASTVEKALNQSTGNVRATELAKRKASGKPITGKLGDIAAVAQAFPAATKETLSSMPGISPLDYGAAGIMGAAGLDWKALATLGVRPAARSLVLSQPYQKAFGQASYNVMTPEKIQQYQQLAQLIARAGAAPAASINLQQ